MTVRFRTIQVTKRYPLQISRGTSTGSTNLFLLIESEGQTGIGECAPGTGFDETLAAQAESELRNFVTPEMIALGPHEVYRRGVLAGLDSGTLAALDIAQWDLLAKQAGMPLYRLFGLGKPTVPTSVTMGINPVEVIRERTPKIIQESNAKALKIKLGNPAGIDADQASYEAAREAALPFGVKLRVDANGGWSAADAKKMITWLSERGCDYVEQPLEAGREAELPEVFAKRELPIFLDESIRTSQDVTKFGDRCDGINLKLMKTGGLTEALRLVATARAHGLKTMIGCMGESSVAIGAGSAIGALFDHIDLDSHLNLNPDPAEGLRLVDGVVMPSDEPGLGVRLVAEE